MSELEAQRLREALEDMAYQAGDYDVYDKAVARAKRRRKWWLPVMAAAIAAGLPVTVSLAGTANQSNRIDQPDLVAPTVSVLPSAPPSPSGAPVPTVTPDVTRQADRTDKAGRLWPPVRLESPRGHTRTDRHPRPFTVRAETVGGVAFTPRMVTPDVQEIGLRVDGRNPTLWLFEPGAFDATGMRQGTKVALGSGKTAYYRMALYPVALGPGGIGTSEAALAWEYRPGAWAVAYGGSPAAYDGPDTPQPSLPAQPPSTLVKTAKALVVRAPAAARLPFSLSYVPGGLKAVSLSTFPKAGQLDGGVWLHPHRLDVLFADSSVPADLFIAGMPGPVPGWSQTTIVAGRPAMNNGEGFVVDVGDGYFIEIRGALAGLEAEAVINGLELADWRNPAAWYPADTGIPK